MGESKWPDGKTSYRWYDVAGLMAEFEAENGVQLRLEITRAGSAERPDLLLELSATAPVEGSTEVARLGYVKTLASRQRIATLRGLCTFLVYQMDYALGTPEGVIDSSI